METSGIFENPTDERGKNAAGADGSNITVPFCKRNRCPLSFRSRLTLAIGRGHHSRTTN
jgi:hypothetical protein